MKKLILAAALLASAALPALATPSWCGHPGQQVCPAFALEGRQNDPDGVGVGGVYHPPADADGFPIDPTVKAANAACEPPRGVSAELFVSSIPKGSMAWESMQECVPNYPQIREAIKKVTAEIESMMTEAEATCTANLVRKTRPYILNHRATIGGLIIKAIEDCSIHDKAHQEDARGLIAMLYAAISVGKTEGGPEDHCEEKPGKWVCTLSGVTRVYY